MEKGKAMCAAGIAVAANTSAMLALRYCLQMWLNSIKFGHSFRALISVIVFCKRSNYRLKNITRLTRR